MSSPSLADAALAEFVELRDGRVRALVRNGYEQHAERLGLSGDPAAAAGSIPGGRAAHPLVALDGGERAIVRRYHRGGAMRHLNRSRYFLGHRSYHELRVTEMARAAGVRVPVVLAAVERRHALGYHAWLATLWIPDAEDLVGWLTAASSAAGETVLERVGRQVGMMHAGGVAHPDLNLRNVLVTADGGGERQLPTPGSAEDGGERQLRIARSRRDDSGQAAVHRADGARPAVYLIDFDRGRAFPGPVPEPRRRRDLERLARSARKLGALIPPRAWEAFRAGYGDAWPSRLDFG